MYAFFAESIISSRLIESVGFSLAFVHKFRIESGSSKHANVLRHALNVTGNNIVRRAIFGHSYYLYRLSHQFLQIGKLTMGLAIGEFEGHVDWS